VFFSRKKSTNSAFSHGLSAKQTGPPTSVPRFPRDLLLLFRPSVKHLLNRLKATRRCPCPPPVDLAVVAGGFYRRLGPRLPFRCVLGLALLSFVVLL
jgi:hypothetical protein